MPDIAAPDDEPLALYRRRIADGALRADPAQAAAAEKLQRLHRQLRSYTPPDPEAGNGLLARLGFGRKKPAADPPRGLYFWGGVGRGKSMLMDLFFETTPVPRKRRVHFNAFMLEIHQRIHEWRQSGAAAEGDADPIPPLARRVAAEAWLLCFDEFHVVDIADAMILGRLFQALFGLGVIVVATSNWPPDDLYKDGLQRDRFLPFIAMIKKKLEVVQLDGGRDYRLDRLRGRPVYHSPLGAMAHKALAGLFADLTDGAEGQAVTLPVPGARTLEVPRAAKGVAWCDFDALCGRPLGAADYLTLAAAFHTVIIEGVPRFTEARRNEMKRFIVLIDSLYEARRRVVIAAEAPVTQLYAGDSHALEFARTESRLMEMQSVDYIEAKKAA
ncbi:cell division protein ZapE [Inquilinus ginsengisoli]|uniref:Cell division protein ZapE n=1 Tax=Inquilinus ginsengisoli TaxID=363840 RepID=A0ABU1K070_9PROT|nr:cell division protein ZapE [Inquilinus ginsengisoli]MDR6294268.1 cell division protein ZapE [Inquilinus ginsengisoli]